MLPSLSVTQLQVIAGVFGGFISGLLMYFIRQKQKRDGLRTAIATEISMSPVDAVSVAFRDLHSLETPVINENLDKLYLLSDEEISSVISYHEQMGKVRRHIDREADEGMVNIPHHMAETTAEKGNSASRDLAVRIGVNPIPRMRLKWEKRQASKEENDIDLDEQLEKFQKQAERHQREREKLADDIRQNE